jgi:hypothetical protein
VWRITQMDELHAKALELLRIRAVSRKRGSDRDGIAARGGLALSLEDIEKQTKNVRISLLELDSVYNLPVPCDPKSNPTFNELLHIMTVLKQTTVLTRVNEPTLEGPPRKNNHCTKDRRRRRWLSSYTLSVLLHGCRTNDQEPSQAASLESYFACKLLYSTAAVIIIEPECGRCDTGTTRKRSIHHDVAHDYTWVKVFEPRCRSEAEGIRTPVLRRAKAVRYFAQGFWSLKISCK